MRLACLPISAPLLSLTGPPEQAHFLVRPHLLTGVSPLPARHPSPARDDGSRERD